MVDSDKFIIQEWFGNRLCVDYVMRFSVDDIEYILYNVFRNDNNLDMFVARVMYDGNGQEMFVGINDSSEEERIFSIVDTMINKVR